MISSLISFIILLLTHAVAGIYSSTLRYSKKITYIIWGTWIILQGALMFYSEFYATDEGLRFFFGFVLTIIGQYAIFFATTRGRLAQRIFIILTYSILFCISTTVYMPVKTLGDRFVVLQILIQATMYVAMVFYFLRYVCSLCRTAGKNVTTGWKALIFVNAVFLLSVVISSFFPSGLSSFSDPFFVSFAFLSVSIMAVYPVIFSYICSMSEVAEKREIELQNKMLIAQIENESAQFEADSRARHDRRHHNLVMLEFANNNDLSGVKEYLESLVESEDKSGGEEKYCDNRTLQSVLSVYAKRAKGSGISVKISADVGHDVDILPHDLVIVIANLFENAIHGAQKSKSREKVIDIAVKESTQRVLIRVENPCKENLVFDENCYGVGIRSVINTVGKYDGMYDFSATDGIFMAKISLNLK